MQAIAPCRTRLCGLALAAALLGAIVPAAAQANTPPVLDFGGQSFEGWSGLRGDSEAGRALREQHRDTFGPPEPATPVAGPAARPIATAQGAWETPEYQLLDRPTPASNPSAVPIGTAWETPEYELYQAGPR
jgi:hypothetical protein